MSLKLSTGSADGIEAVAPNLVRWRDLSRHPNRAATKAWAMRVTGTHDKYGVDGDWLDKQTVAGDLCFDTSDLAEGDIIKVSGASHSNRKHTYYRVLEVDRDGMAVERMGEADVIEAVESKEPVEALREQVRDLAAECEDEQKLWAAIDALEA